MMPSQTSSSRNQITSLRSDFVACKASEAEVFTFVISLCLLLSTRQIEKSCNFSFSRPQHVSDSTRRKCQIESLSRPIYCVCIDEDVMGFPEGWRWDCCGSAKMHGVLPVNPINRPHDSELEHLGESLTFEYFCIQAVWLLGSSAFDISSLSSKTDSEIIQAIRSSDQRAHDKPASTFRINLVKGSRHRKSHGIIWDGSAVAMGKEEVNEKVNVLETLNNRNDSNFQAGRWGEKEKLVSCFQCQCEARLGLSNRGHKNHLDSRQRFFAARTRWLRF